jgi:hypothetical protein
VPQSYYETEYIKCYAETSSYVNKEKYNLKVFENGTRRGIFAGGREEKWGY